MEGKFKVITGIPNEVENELNSLNNEETYVKVINTTYSKTGIICVVCYLTKRLKNK
jgi:hypothetical protein